MHKHMYVNGLEHSMCVYAFVISILMYAFKIFIILKKIYITEENVCI